MAGMAGVPKLAAVIEVKMSLITSMASCWAAVVTSFSSRGIEVVAASLAVRCTVLYLWRSSVTATELASESALAV